MTTHTTMVLIGATITFIVDVSGFPDAVKEGLSRWLGRKVTRLKPFDCSLCAVWWGTLIYALCVHHLTFATIAFAGLLSLLAYPCGALMILVQQTLLVMIDRLREWMNV